MKTQSIPTIFVSHKEGDETFTISFAYDKYLVSRVKKLEGASWNGSVWVVPVMTKSMRLINGEMKPTNQLKKVVNEEFLTPHVSCPVVFS